MLPQYLWKLEVPKFGENYSVLLKCEHFLRHNKFGLLISRCSVATYLRYGAQCYVSFVENFIAFLALAVE